MKPRSKLKRFITSIYAQILVIAFYLYYFPKYLIMLSRVFSRILLSTRTCAF